jgi:signal transduction histidine kinase
MQNEADNLTDTQRNLLTECRGRIAILSQYVDDIAKLEYVALTTQTLEPRQYKLQPLLDAVIAECNLPISVKHIHLVVETADVALEVTCNPSLLQLAFLNVLDNAIKYTDEGGEVSIRVTVVDSWVQIAVADTGLGVPSAEVPQLFTQYVRLTNVQKTDIPGSGLGLSIAHSIMAAHHGTITYSAHVPRGSVFTLSLPITATS